MTLSCIVTTLCGMEMVVGVTCVVSLLTILHGSIGSSHKPPRHDDVEMRVCRSGDASGEDIAH